MYDFVYTVGFFNNFHYGHYKLIERMSKIGKKIVVGVYDDHTLSLTRPETKDDHQPLEARMAKLKEYVDMIFVIPSLDPELYLKMMVDPDKKVRKCFCRADNIKWYPGWRWIKDNMSVEIFPYTYITKNVPTENNLGNIPQVLNDK